MQELLETLMAVGLIITVVGIIMTTIGAEDREPVLTALGVVILSTGASIALILSVYLDYSVGISEWVFVIGITPLFACGFGWVYIIRLMKIYDKSFE